jgi:hypothetical protein
VLDKLRYMRGREPLPGYDALSLEEIVAALEEADLATIRKVRNPMRCHFTESPLARCGHGGILRAGTREVWRRLK